MQGTIRKIWTWCLNAAHQQERYLLSTTSCRRMMLVLHISAESVKRLQHICILDALRSPERERKCSWSVAAAAARQPELKLSDSFLKHTIVLSQCTIIYLWLLSFQQDHSELMKYSNILVRLGGIQVLRHQRGGWVGSENGNFWWFTVL